MICMRDKVFKIQWRGTEVNKMIDKVKLGVETPFRVLNDGMVVMGEWMYMPDYKALKEKVLREAHKSRFVVHPRRLRCIGT